MTTLSLNVPRIRSAIRDLRVTIRNRPGEGWTPPDWLRWLPPEDRSWIVGPVPTHHHLIWACMAWVRSLVGNDWADTSAIDGADLDVRSKDALYRLHGCVTGGFDPSQISTHPPTENWTLKELDDILNTSPAERKWWA